MMDLEGWIPCRLYGESKVEWCYMGSHRFTDPFFETTMHFEVNTPFNSVFRFRTPFETLGDWYEKKPGLKPTGFIFHLSRCGSTLITQLLASLPRNLVLSEPGLLGTLMHSTTSVEHLRWLVSALGQPRTGQEQHLFIKFDPINILDFPLLRLAFPDVPVTFVYRDPVEIMLSHLLAPAPFMTRGLMDLGLDPEQMDDEEYGARILGILTEAVVQHAGSARLINYTQLPDVVWNGFPANEIEHLKEVATFDAKHPRKRFASEKREAPEKVRALVNRWIMPHYLQLEQLRQPRGG